MRALILLSVAALAQTPQFEVVSIHPSPPPDYAHGMTVGCSGGPVGYGDPSLFRCQNIGPSTLISMAYSLKPYQFPTPEWMKDVRIDISAKIPEGTAKDQFPLMMKTLLVERFKLAVHWEKKEMTGYDLLLAKGGAKFKESKGEPEGDDVAWNMQKDAEGYPVLPGNKSTMAAIAGGYSTQRWANEPVESIAGMLEFRLNGAVDNATGLTGKYDMLLHWIMDGGRVSDDIHGPTLLQALQDQLGLRVQKKKVTVDVLVVDHLEKAPTEN